MSGAESRLPRETTSVPGRVASSPHVEKPRQQLATLTLTVVIGYHSSSVFASVGCEVVALSRLKLGLRKKVDSGTNKTRKCGRRMRRRSASTRNRGIGGCLTYASARPEASARRGRGRCCLIDREAHGGFGSRASG